MIVRLKRRLTFANVASAFALFIAIGGGSALALAGQNTVDSGDIINGQVKTPDLANGAVTRAKLAPSARAVRQVGPVRLKVAPGSTKTLIKANGVKFTAACVPTGEAYVDASAPAASAAAPATLSGIEAKSDGSANGINTDLSGPGGVVILHGSGGGAWGAGTVVTAPPGNHQVSFDLYSGRGANGQSSNRCVFGGYVVVG